MITGCVAVDETGARLGKGGGFADLITCDGSRRSSSGIFWESLTEEKIAAIPLLRRLREGDG